MTAVEPRDHPLTRCLACGRGCPGQVCCSRGIRQVLLDGEPYIEHDTAVCEDCCVHDPDLDPDEMARPPREVIAEARNALVPVRLALEEIAGPGGEDARAGLLRTLGLLDELGREPVEVSLTLRSLTQVTVFECVKCGRRLALTQVTVEEEPYGAGRIAYSGEDPVTCPHHGYSTYYLYPVDEEQA